MVYIRIGLKSASKDSLTKMPLAKLRLFCMLFLEKEAQMDQKNYQTMLFMSKQVSLPKISSILQKVKIGPKTDIPVRPFCTKAFNYENIMINVYITTN